MNDASFALISVVIGLMIGLNPLSISLFTAYIAARKGKGQSNNRYTMYGFLFLGITLFMLGVASYGVSTVVSALTDDGALVASIVTVVVMVIVGCIILHSYFFEGAPLVLRPAALIRPSLHANTVKKSGILSLMRLVGLFGLILLPIAGLTIMSLSLGADALGLALPVWLSGFLFGFITPLYGILALLSNRVRPGAILSWLERSRPSLYASNGVALIIAAWTLAYLLIDVGANL